MNLYITNNDSINMDKLFVLAELYNDGRIIVCVKNIEKLNKKYGCKIDPHQLGLIYADDYDKAVEYATIEIYKTTGKKPSNLVHILGTGDGRQEPDKKVCGRIVLLDVSPKSVSMKEHPTNNKFYELIVGTYEKQGIEVIKRKGKK